jgi:hypothetical protein
MSVKMRVFLKSYKSVKMTEKCNKRIESTYYLFPYIVTNIILSVLYKFSNTNKSHIITKIFHS